MLIKKTYASFKKEEFIDYFSKIGVQKSDGIYIGDGWEVEIKDEKNKFIGEMRFITIELIIRVEDTISKEFIDELRLAFLRGGG